MPNRAWSSVLVTVSLTGRRAVSRNSEPRALPGHCDSVIPRHWSSYGGSSPSTRTGGSCHLRPEGCRNLGARSSGAPGRAADRARRDVYHDWTSRVNHTHYSSIASVARLTYREPDEGSLA